MKTTTNRKLWFSFAVATALINSISMAADGGTPSDIQATARPFGLSIVGPVMVSGSDSAAASFNATVLPEVNQLINVKLSEQVAINDSTMLIDPSKLTLSSESAVRVYFVGEGAGYHNSLGFNTTGSGVDTGNPLLIFPDASSSVGVMTSGTGVRTGNEPLLPGDFVNLGTLAAGTKLDFFLISDAVNGGTSVFTANSASNPDGINHVVAFTAQAVKDSPYLVISFEDMLNGGDRDFNDAIFVVDIGAANVEKLIGAPEPSTYLSLGGFLGAAVWFARRRKQAAVCTH